MMDESRIAEMRQLAGCVGMPKSQWLDECLDEIERLREDILPRLTAAEAEIKRLTNKAKPHDLADVAVWVNTIEESDAVQDCYFALGKQWQFGEHGMKKSALRQCFISVEAPRHMVTGLMVWNATNEWGAKRECKVVMSAQTFLSYYSI